MTEPVSFVLDSFALLAYLQDEPVALRIERLLSNAANGKCRLFLSMINLGEILYITERRGGIVKAQDTLALIQQLPIQVLSVEDRMVLAAAHIKANHPISYADSFAVAIAVQENATVVTGDPEFHSVETIVQVEWLQITE
jgi:predicted nucleic acid-binding protein